MATTRHADEATVQLPAHAATLTQAGGDIAPKAAPANFAPPGYEIVGELGRGGMGVVYKARQKSLNRSVALKVILGAGHAGADSLARFRSEATTAAQLQHPNIVQIFEVGEHEGQPFFSLELVDGGSLADRLNGEPQPPRDAAEMVRSLALAVQQAHSKGVVHRDLKPANVLLARESDSTKSIPKITDFGLAKQQSNDSGLTASGAILGTPSYMAPEQAAGRGGEVGPAADVYALGAILYEMLTGRPPFKAATVMDTVLQVMSDEPVPPSRLQPKLPRDLETICLKCLAKKPDQRYASASALADDLGRFLNGESILARPTSSLRKLGKWAKRYPALAAIVFILAVPLPILLGTMVFLWAQTRESKREIEYQKVHSDRAHADAERERQLAQGYLKNAILAMDQILERVADERFSRIPAIQDERSAIIAEAVLFFESLLRLDHSDPTVREETAQMFARVARLTLMGGRTEQSARAAASSVELFKGLANDRPEQPEFRHELASAYMFLGHSKVLNSEFDDGLKAYGAAAETIEKLVAEYPDRSRYRALAAECRRSLGYFHSNANRSGSEGESNFKIALQFSTELLEQHPANPEHQVLHASILGAYSQYLVMRQRRTDAEPLVKQGLELIKLSRDSLPRKGSARMHFDQAALMLRLSAANLKMTEGKKGQGIETLQNAAESFELLMTGQPLAFPQRLQGVQTYTALALVLRQEKRFDEALKATKRIVELYDDMLTDFPAFRDSQRSMWFHQQRVQGVAMHLNNLLATKRYDEARKSAAELESSPAARGALAYNIGCIFVLLAENAKDASQREKDFASAMRCLKIADATGYPALPSEVEHVRQKDTDLKALRPRPEFQDWANGLKAKKE